MVVIMLNHKLFFLSAGLAFMFGWGAHAAFYLASPDGNLVTGAVVGISDDLERSAANTSAWTKAICDDNHFCIDVLITCENGKVVALKPMMNGTQFSDDWEDPRSDELRSGFC